MDQEVDGQEITRQEVVQQEKTLLGTFLLGSRSSSLAFKSLLGFFVIGNDFCMTPVHCGFHYLVHSQAVVHQVIACCQLRLPQLIFKALQGCEQSFDLEEDGVFVLKLRHGDVPGKHSDIVHRVFDSLDKILLLVPIRSRRRWSRELRPQEKERDWLRRSSALAMSFNSLSEKWRSTRPELVLMVAEVSVVKKYNVKVAHIVESIATSFSGIQNRNGREIILSY